MTDERPNRADQPQERDARYREFVTLLARHDQVIRRFIRSVMPSSQGIDDVMQETALECWNQFSRFQPQCPEDAGNEFVRWACVVARYKALSWQRDRSRDRLVFRDSVIEKLADAAVDHIEQREQERQAIESCLMQLQEDQRRLVLSVHSPGESVARIAAETGENARRLYRKVNHLRNLLLDCVQRKLMEEAAHG